VHIVTRAKSNVVGYQPPPPKTGSRGRPRKYGAKLKLMDLFETMSESFEQVTIALYGQSKTISFLCLDLIWKPIGEKLRFVLVCDGSDYHQTIWEKYLGWLRTVTSTIPTEEIVKSAIQQEYYHNFRFFNNNAIYQIILSKSKKRPEKAVPLAV